MPACVIGSNMSPQILLSEIESAPEEIRRKVWDFLRFLKSQRSLEIQEEDSTLHLAQTSWGPDWSSAEEDEAWKDL